MYIADSTLTSDGAPFAVRTNLTTGVTPLVFVHSAVMCYYMLLGVFRGRNEPRSCLHSQVLFEYYSQEREAQLHRWWSALSAN